MMKKFTIIGTIFILLLWAFNINFYRKNNISTISTQTIGKKDYLYYLSRIKKDRKWMGQIKKEAEKKSVSVDSVLSETARYWETKELKKTKSKVKNYLYYLKRIRNDKNWMNYINKEAQNNNLPVDSIVSKTAYEWEVKELEKEKGIIKDYEYYLKRINSDENWMKYIKKESEEKNLSVDSILSKTAYEWEKKHK